MKLVSSLHEMHSARLSLSGVVGLVPTMGYLHEGHLSLVRRAREDCDHVVVSIFVNPTQFGPNEDLAKYPRNLKGDLELLEPLGVDVVWNPGAEEMYPEGYQTWVEVEKLTLPLEGASRPGHFRGVTTIVSKLFNAVQPHKAYFGQKDAQQAAVIRQMTRDLKLPDRGGDMPDRARAGRTGHVQPEQISGRTQPAGRPGPFACAGRGAGGVGGRRAKRRSRCEAACWRCLPRSRAHRCNMSPARTTTPWKSWIA